MAAPDHDAVERVERPAVETEALRGEHDRGPTADRRRARPRDGSRRRRPHTRRDRPRVFTADGQTSAKPRRSVISCAGLSQGTAELPGGVLLLLGQPDPVHGGADGPRGAAAPRARAARPSPTSRRRDAGRLGADDPRRPSAAWNRAYAAPSSRPRYHSRKRWMVRTPPSRDPRAAAASRCHGKPSHLLRPGTIRTSARRSFGINALLPQTLHLCSSRLNACSSSCRISCSPRLKQCAQ